MLGAKCPVGLFVANDLATHGVELQRLVNQRGHIAQQEQFHRRTATARLMTTEKLMRKTPEDRGSKSLDDLRLAQIEAREAIKVAEARKLLLEKYDRKTKTAMLDLAIAEKRMLRARQEHAFEKAQRIAEAELTASQLALTRDQRHGRRAL